MAQVDSSIALGVKPFQVPDPVNALARMMQIQGLQGQQQLAQYTLKKAEREDGEVNALNAAYAGALGADGKIDRNKLFSSVAQGGFGSRLPAIQKTFADQDAAQTTADAAKFKLANDRYGIFQKTMGALKDMPNLSKQIVMEAGANLVQQGILSKEMYDGAVANMPDDPMQLRQRLTQGLATQLPPEKVFELFAPKAEKFDTGGQIITRDMNPNSPTYGQQTGGAPIAKVQSPESVASVAATLRGQNMTDARAREQINAGKAPAGYRWAADGKTLEAIPGGPAIKDKAPTEFQGKSATYGARAEEADKIITELEGKYSPAAVNAKQAAGAVWGIGGALEAGANVALSKEAQRAEQAQRNFINAVLRQESGAAIADSEFNNAKKQYFPQPGDSKEVIAQKAANRRTAIAGFKSNAGPAAVNKTGGATGSWDGGPDKVVDFGSLK